ncbi:MAG: hypothetical protein HYR97_06305 [Candidatus Melainabacteria bacterium]|nr:hypothetical protein [Candidatus Melainabacteria bacterium]
MRNKLIILFLALLFFQFFNINFNAFAMPSITEEAIGKINNEVLPKSQKQTPDVNLARKELLTKAKLYGVSVDESEFEKIWNQYVHNIGGFEKLAQNAKDAKITIEFVKNKIKDNLLLDKFFKEEAKHKIVELMVDEKLVLQEAKKRNITVPDNEVTEKLDKIIEKEGGLEAFSRFLLANKATFSDAKKEVENKLLFDLVKQNITEETVVNDFDIQRYYETHISDFKNVPMELVKGEIIEIIKEQNGEEAFNFLIKDRKLNSEIIVYNKSTFNNLKKPSSQIAANESLPLRSKTYPTITKQTVEPVINTATEKKEIVEVEIKEQPPANTQDPNPLKKLSINKLFDKIKSPEDTDIYKDFPVLSDKQRQELNKAIKLREEIAIEKTTEKVTYAPDEKLNTIPSQEQITSKETLQRGFKTYEGFKKEHKAKANTIPANNVNSLESNKVEIIGHRGNPYVKVENTIESIISAWASGADAAEIDLQLTSDGEVILFHDTVPIERISAGFVIQNSENKPTSDFSFSELKNVLFDKDFYEKQISTKAGIPVTLQLKYPVSIAKLDELTIPENKKLYLELKCNGMDDSYKTQLVQKVSDWIKNNNYYNRARIISFDSICLQKAKKTDTAIFTGLIIEKNPTHNEVILENIKTTVGVDFILPTFKDTNVELVNACKKAGLEVIPWAMHETTKEEFAEITRLLDLGVYGLITNQPTASKYLLTNNKPKPAPEKPPVLEQNQAADNNTLTKPKQLSVPGNNPPSLNVLKEAPETTEPTNNTDNLKADLEELRRKINQRRVSKKEN